MYLYWTRGWLWRYPLVDQNISIEQLYQSLKTVYGWAGKVSYTIECSNIILVFRQTTGGRFGSSDLSLKRLTYEYVVKQIRLKLIPSVLIYSLKRRLYTLIWSGKILLVISFDWRGVISVRTYPMNKKFTKTKTFIHGPPHHAPWHRMHGVSLSFFDLKQCCYVWLVNMCTWPHPLHLDNWLVSTKCWFWLSVFICG